MARSMLKNKKMPKEFWAKVIDYAVYLSNHSSNQSTWNKTSQQVWNKRKQKISHLRVFESIAYVHVFDQKRSKLDDKNEKYVFIDYNSSSKGYKFYNPKNGKSIIGRDVKFKEEEEWNWDAKKINYPLYEEKEQTRRNLQEMTIPLSWPPPSTHEVPTILIFSFKSWSEQTSHFRSLQEIYKRTKNQMI